MRINQLNELDMLTLAKMMLCIILQGHLLLSCCISTGTTISDGPASDRIMLPCVMFFLVSFYPSTEQNTKLLNY